MTSEFKWGTVTDVGPLRVQLDGDTKPLPFVPDSLVDPLALSVDDRVRCELARRRVVIVGRSGGDTTPRQVPWTTTATLAAGAEVELTVTLPQACAVTRIVTSRAARVRLYDRAAKSTADAARASGVYPTGDHGLLLELDGGTAAEDTGFYPKAIVSNRDGSTAYKMRVKNLSATAAIVTGSLWVVL